MFGSLIRRKQTKRPLGDDNIAFESTTFSLSTAVPRPSERRVDERLIALLRVAKLTDAGGRDQLHSVAADAPVQDAIELLAEHDLDQVAVFDEYRFVGFLTRSDVMRQLQLREALDV